jgi:hypothetical protein
LFKKHRETFAPLRLWIFHTDNGVLTSWTGC